jgi:hypothetical protein
VSRPALPAQLSPSGAIALAVAACIPYGLLIVSLIYGPPGGDPSQYGPKTGSTSCLPSFTRSFSA